MHYYSVWIKFNVHPRRDYGDTYFFIKFHEIQFNVCLVINQLVDFELIQGQ